MKQIFILSFLIFSSLGVYAQSDSTIVVPNYNDSLITIKGRVLDTTQIVSFYNVMIVNKTAGKGIFGSYDGTFKITVKKSDLVGLSVTG